MGSGSIGIDIFCYLYIVAGIQLVVCFVVAALMFHTGSLQVGGTPMSVFVWTLFGCGMCYSVGSFMAMAFFADLPDARDFVLKFGILGIGGFLFALSSYGAAPWCISLNYISIRGAYPADHPYYTKPESLGEGLPPHPFLNTCAHFGVLCFCVGTTWLNIGFEKATEGLDMMKDPWYSTLFLAVGSFIIGIVFLWGPTIAAGFTSFDDLAVAQNGMANIVKVPAFAWMWRLWIAAIGGMFLLLGAYVFAGVLGVL